MLSAFQFGTLKSIFEERTGLQFDESNRSQFQSKLLPRLQTQKVSSFAAYTQLIEQGHKQNFKPGLSEIDNALELLTVGETYFFRHDEQMELLKREILPALAEQYGDKRNLAIWSAGCSSGEELLSIAILAMESGLFEDWELTLLGGDLSRQRIEKARAGLYSDGAFRTTSNTRRDSFFDREENGWRIKPAIQSLCQFHLVNLLNADSFSWIGRVHLVLCRNVLIYLSAEARTQVLASLHARLHPGGYLLLGHSELLPEIPAQLQGLGRNMAYQRPAAVRLGGKS